MTAILYAVAGGAALLLMHRLVRPISYAAAAALLLLPLCFTGRALLTGRVYAPLDIVYGGEPLHSVAAEHGIGRPRNQLLSDVSLLMIPWRAAVRHALANGEWPLWNPFIFCGDVLAASSEPAPYHPMNLLALLLPQAQSMTLVAALTFFLAGLSMFAFVRELGCAEPAAVFGAAAWMYSSFLAFFVEYPIGSALLLLPLVCLGVRRILAGSSIGLLVTALALLVLAGHPETTLHVVGLGSLYGLFHLPWTNAAASGRALRGAVVAGVLALMLTAFFLLPFVDALTQSQDFTDRVRKYARQDRSASWSDASDRLWPNIVPFVYGWPRPEGTGLPPNYHTPHASYAGSLLLPLAIAGFLATRRRDRMVLSVLIVLGCLAAAAAPGVADLLGRLPLFSIAINERLIFGTTFALVVLASLGLDMQRGGWSQVALNLAVALVLVITMAVKWNTMRSIGLDLSFLRQNAFWLVAPLAAAASLHAFVRLRRFAPPLLLALVLVQRSAESGGLYPTFPPQAFYPRIPMFELLTGTGRVAATGLILIPNISAHYRLEDPRGFTGTNFGRLAQTFPLWSVPQPVFFNRIDNLNAPFLSFLNVRYALTRVGEAVPAGWRLVGSWKGIQTVENLSVLPRVFLPENVRLNKIDYLVVDDMYMNRDFRRLAWINVPAAPRSAMGTDRQNGSGHLAARRSGSGYEVDAVMKEPGWVVVSETAWRGWKVFVDGRRVPVAFANHAFLGFHLEAGHHQVTIRYWPDSFRIGLAVSSITGAALLLNAIVAWARLRSVRYSRDALSSTLAAPD